MKLSTGAVIGLAGLMAVLGGAAPALAQNKAPNVEVGYQFQRLMEDGDSLNLPAGFNAAVTFPVNDNIDVLGQIDWSRKSEFDVTETLTGFGGGVRWSHRQNMNVTPFAQVVAGAARAAASSDLFSVDDSETKGMVQIGGGVAGPINPKLDWLAQFDYRRIFSESGTNAIRFVAGVRLKLK